MNKALHVFVYLFLIGVGVSLWYEYQLNDKRTELKDRNRMMEDYLIRVAPLVEAGNDYDPTESEPIMMDSDDPTDHTKVEPNEVNLLEDVDDYNAALEKLDHNLLSWGEDERKKLREIYIIDPETGKPMMDGTEKLTRGSPEQLLLEELIKALSSQKEQLKKTREALPPLREKIKYVANEYNKVTPVLRSHVATNIQQKAQIEDLTKKNTALLEKQVEYENQIKEKELEIVSLRDEVETAKNETEVVKEDLDKQNKMIELLKKQIQDLIAQNKNPVGGGGSGSVVSTLPFGDKGEILRANNEDMFAIVKLTPEAMKQLKGDDLQRPMPMLELGVKRAGFNGAAGEFVGRIRLRQEVPGKNYVTCDILTNWAQDELKPGDVVFAE